MASSASSPPPSSPASAAAPGAAPHVHPPKQARSRRTLRSIVDAALELMADQGVESTTVADIVGRSGTSVGSFYARFDGKEDLVAYLEERVWSDARGRWDDALVSASWDDLALDELTRGVVRLLLGSYRADLRQRRAFGAGGRAATFHAHVQATLEDLLLGRSEAIRHPDPPRAVAVGYRMVAGGIRQILEEAEQGVGRRAGREGVAPAGPAAGLDDDVLVRELGRAFAAYLGGGTAGDEAPPAGAAEAVDFFDIWA